MLVTRHRIWTDNWIYWLLTHLITNHYNAFPNIHALQITTAYTESQSLVTAPNHRDSPASVLMSLLVGYSLTINSWLQLPGLSHWSWLYSLGLDYTENSTDHIENTSSQSSLPGPGTTTSSHSAILAYRINGVIVKWQWTEQQYAGCDCSSL
jgi:hypothetical protein